MDGYKFNLFQFQKLNFFRLNVHYRIPDMDNIWFDFTPMGNNLELYFTRVSQDLGDGNLYPLLSDKHCRGLESNAQLFYFFSSDELKDSQKGISFDGDHS